LVADEQYQPSNMLEVSENIFDGITLPPLQREGKAGQVDLSTCPAFLICRAFLI
jgi:hypothetical protein